MIDRLKLLARFVVSLFRSKGGLEAEILVLRHQLKVMRRGMASRARLTLLDQLFFAWLYRRIGRPGLVLLALVVAGCAPTPRLDEIAASLPPSGNNARLFVYRAYDLSQSLTWEPVYVNGTEIGGVGPGHVLVCDLPPGLYTIAPRAERLWPDQAKTVRVAAGEAVYAKVGSFWMVGFGTRPFKLAALQMAGVTVNGGTNLVPIFVVMLQDPANGRHEVGTLWYAPCNPPYAPG